MQSKTFTKPGATKTSKYFSQSNQASQPSNSILNGGLSGYLSKMNQRSNQRRQYSPKPDYNYSSHIKQTAYPSLKYPNLITQPNRNTHHKQNSQTTRTPIKIQDNDVYTDDMVFGLARRHQLQNNRTEGQFRYANQQNRNHSQSMDFAITPPIKLRDLQDKNKMESYRSRVNTQNASFQESRRISGQKSRQKQRQKFDSNMTQYNKQLEYSKIVTKTLEQTIDQNVKLKMDYDLLKQMHKQALKTIVNLQQIMVDKIPKQSLADNANINKLQPKEFKKVYEKLFPFENINKLIKPSLQAELHIYKQKQYERNAKAKKQAGQLETSFQVLQQKQQQTSKQNVFLKQQNVNLRLQLQQLKLKAQLQSQNQKEQKKQQNIGYKINKAYTFEGQKNQIQILPETINNSNSGSNVKNRTESAPLSNFNSEQKNQEKIAKQGNQQYISKRDFETAIKDIQMQKKIEFGKAEQKIKVLDQRCKQLQAIVDTMLEERRKAKEHQNKNTRQMLTNKKVQAEIDSHQPSDNSQILGQSKISQVSSKLKTGIGMIKLMKNQDEKYTNTSITVIKASFEEQRKRNDPKQQPKPEVKTQNKQIQIRDSKQQQQRQQQRKRLLEKQQQMAFKIQQLQQNLLRSENLRSSYEEQRQSYRIRLNTVLAKIKLIRERIQVCNIDNFQYLVKQFMEIIEEKKHLIIRIEQLVNQKPQKVWQLQKQLNQTKKRKKQLVDRCIRLQKYIQQNVNEGRNSHDFIIDGLYDRYFEENEVENLCTCPFQKARSKINEEEGKCALDWVQYLHQAMIQTIKDLDALLCGNLEEKP